MTYRISKENVSLNIKKGFVLMDALAALVIFSTGLIVIFGSLRHCRQAAVSLENSNAALREVRNILLMRFFQKQLVGHTPVDQSALLGSRVGLDRYDVSFETFSDEPFVHEVLNQHWSLEEITVSWKEGARVRSLTLPTLVKDRALP